MSSSRISCDDSRISSSEGVPDGDSERSVFAAETGSSREYGAHVLLIAVHRGMESDWRRPRLFPAIFEAQRDMAEGLWRV